MNFDQEVELAKNQFEAYRPTPEGMMPIARLSTPVGEIVCGLVGLDTAEVRERALVELVTSHEASECVFIADVWVKTFPNKDVVPMFRPSQYSDRTEAMTVTVVTQDEATVGLFPYRVEDDRVIWTEGSSVFSNAEGLHNAVQAAIRREES